MRQKKLIMSKMKKNYGTFVNKISMDKNVNFL